MTNNEDARPGDDWRDDDVRGADVSRAYRDAAIERTPPHLDAAVLAAARRGARNRYAVSVHWLRPMAWAATIGLCLAIVIDINTIPDQAAPDLYEGMAVIEPGVDSTAVEARPAAAPENAARQRLEFSVDAPSASRPDRGSGEVDAALEPTAELLQFDAAADESGPVREDKVVVEPNKQELGFGAAAADVDNASLERAAELPALRKAATACTPDETGDPDRWLQCIERLEQQGRSDEADDERRRFDLKYPNYAVD